MHTLATGALADVRALLTYGERLAQALAETQLLREFAAQAQASMHTMHAGLATEQTQRQRAQAEIVSLKAHHAAEVALQLLGEVANVARKRVIIAEDVLNRRASRAWRPPTR